MIPTLVLPDGRRIELVADIVLGRAPVAPEWSPSARSISVSVPTISKTHALIGHDVNGVWLVDLYSSNGSESLDDDGVSERAVPGRRLTIPAGAHIRVGTDTIITIDSGGAPHDEDPDRTMVVRAAPPAPALAPAPTSTPPTTPGVDPTDPIDWSAVTGQNTVVPPAPEPAAAAPSRQESTPTPQPTPQPTTARTPPPQPIPSQPAPPRSLPPEPFSASATPTQEFAVTPGAVTPGNVAPGAFDRQPVPSSGGRSVAHLAGAIIVLVWSAVGFATIRGWTPDTVFDVLDGRILDFFFVPDRFTLQFAEFFAIGRLPDSLTFLARAGDVGPVVAIIMAGVALFVPGRVVRWVLVALVAIPMALLFGLVVTFASDSIDLVIEEFDRLIQWFVLPGIGSLLLLWPRRRPASDRSAGGYVAHPPSQDVFYAPGQSPEPPSADPGASPFS